MFLRGLSIMTVGSWSGLTTTSYSSRPALVKPSRSVPVMRKRKESVAVHFAMATFALGRVQVISGAWVLLGCVLGVDSFWRTVRLTGFSSSSLLKETERVTVEPTVMKAGALARLVVSGGIWA